LQIGETQAKIAELGARTRLQDAKAQNAALEPQFRRAEIATKGIYQVAEDQQKGEFDRRMRLADLVLKDKDIASNERIAKIQASGNVASTQSKSKATVASEYIRAQAQPKEAAPAPAPMPVPVPVPVPRPVPVPVPMPFGGPLVGRQAVLRR
jgi:hypothetical protein